MYNQFLKYIKLNLIIITITRKFIPHYMVLYQVINKIKETYIELMFFCIEIKELLY